MAVKIKGARKLRKTLHQLPRKTQKRVIARGVAGAAKEASRRIKAATPINTEQWNIPNRLLRRSIGRKRKGYQATGTAFEVIGPRNDAKFYVAVRGRSTGSQTGVQFVPMTRVAQFVERDEPFMRPAIDSARSQLLKTMERDIRTEVLKAAQEARR